MGKPEMNKKRDVESLATRLIKKIDFMQVNGREDI